MMKKFIAMAAAVAAAPAADDWKIDLDMLQGGLEANDQPYVFPTGTKVTITAIENRSWGYEWAITNECDDYFKLVDDSYGYEHDSNTEQLALGRRGRRTLIFETPASDSVQAAQGVKECTMTFMNKRPWLL